MKKYFFAVMNDSLKKTMLTTYKLYFTISRNKDKMNNVRKLIGISIRFR